MEEDNVAIYLDFENLAISAEQTCPSQEMPLLLGPIVDFAASKGNVCIKKAYGDWSRPIFHQYQKVLVEHGFEMVYMPETTYQGKNGADVRMAIDVMEHMEHLSMVSTFMIGSGDTDFIPLIQRVLSRGKSVIVIGFEQSVGRLIKSNCTEFRSLDELLGVSEDAEAEVSPSEAVEETDLNRLDGRELMVRYIRSRSDEGPVQMSRLKQDLLRLEPSFSEKQIGFQSFKKFVESMLDDVVEEIRADPETDLPLVSLRELSEIPDIERDTGDEICGFLTKTLKFQDDCEIRAELARHLFVFMEREGSATMHDMIDYLSWKVSSVSKVAIRKYVNTLFSARAFVYAEQEIEGSVLSRSMRFKDSVNTPERVGDVYMARVSEILSNRFHSVDDSVITCILGD